MSLGVNKKVKFTATPLDHYSHTDHHHYRYPPARQQRQPHLTSVAHSLLLEILGAPRAELCAFPWHVFISLAYSIV